MCENHGENSMEEFMPKRLSAVSLFVFAVCLCSAAQTKSHAAKKADVGPPPDKAYLQSIWDGWSTLNPANVEKYYATGTHTFFDIAPLKYSSFDEYEKGVKAVVSGYKSARFTLNDDLALHPHGDLVWATATVAEQMTTTAGKVDMGNFRWTVVFEYENGKWLIVHEHVSAPIQ